MSRWTQLEPPRQMVDFMLEGGGMDLQVWRNNVNGLRAIRCREPVDRARGSDMRWHLSVSHPARLPTWEEMGEAKDRLIPKDTFMCLPHPPREYWINLHNYCLHLWEFHDGNLREQFAWEGEEWRRR